MAEITAIPHHDDIASSSTASCSASVSDPCVKCDIYINHCQQDAGNFATELCNLLQSLGLQVFLDKLEFDSEEEVKSRKETAISQAAVRIAIFSPDYANWKWCLDALVNMTKSGGTIIPVFYKVEPSEVRFTGGQYAVCMLDHEEKLRYNSETIQNWKDALFQGSHRSGLELVKCKGDEQDLSRKVVQSVFKDSPGLRYNVFLSHRGPDTKEEFASPLYARLLFHRIRAFLDTRELVKGHQIAPQLELAIQFASVNIVIFSPKFAESSWCLEELFLMTKSAATILPVFYAVNPSVLNGQYVEALFHHLKKEHPVDPDTVERWRYALADVPDLNDFVLDSCKLNSNKKEELQKEFIVKIVQRVSEILSKPSEVGQSYEVVQRTAECVLQENVPKRPEVVQRAPVEENYVGLSEKIQYFEKVVLSQQEEHVKVVGILGGVGLGKTTMAEFYFQLRKSCYREFSFLYNVRERFFLLKENNVRERALKDLQSKVIEDLKHSPNIRIESVEEGVEMFKQLLPSCHALVILDDVDHVDQLHALLPIKYVLDPNSLILVTSRDKDVLNRSGIADSSIYHLVGLNKQDSKRLLLSHANPSGDLEFEDLVDEFVTTCDGLPLALKVLGKLLSGKRRSVWEERLNRLHDCVLPVEIEYSLKNSYDSLDPEEQEIFLDVACLFTEQDKDTAIRIWGMAGLKKLENRCVVQVCKNNKIEMNGLLGNYGRNIARRLEPRRLWHQETEQINDLLEKSSSELAQFRGITMNRGPRDETEMPCCKQSGEKFSGTSNLNFLAAQGGYVENILTRVGSPDLLWLNWYKCTHSSPPSWIPREKLRVLEVDGSKLTELWQPESKPPVQLRELNIFAPLSEFPKSIEHLEHLEKIVVKYYRPLPFKTFPEEFCSLLLLKHLELMKCSSMMSLPDSFGDLKNLQYLDLKGASSLRKLPYSFGKLTLLKYLSLKGCSEIRELPGLEHFTSLETLDVTGCKNLESIPELGQLIKLQILDVSGCSQIQTPLGLEHLNSLETFNVRGCRKLQSISGLGQLTKLSTLDVFFSTKTLDVSRCSEIVSLPDLQKLTSLKSLNVSRCQKLQSIPGLGKLTKLQRLDVSGCSEIQTLPDLEHLTSDAGASELASNVKICSHVVVGQSEFH